MGLSAAHRLIQVKMQNIREYYKRIWFANKLCKIILSHAKDSECTIPKAHGRWIILT